VTHIVLAVLLGLAALPGAAQDRVIRATLDPTENIPASGEREAPPARREQITIRLVFEPSAAEALGEGDTAVIDLWLYGEPASEDIPVDDSGYVTLWRERLRVDPVDQVISPMTDLIEFVLESSRDEVEEPYLLVYVTSSLHLVHDVNPYSCNVVRDRIAVLEREEAVVVCRREEEWLGPFAP
jgi:hypothetical protein